jgi:hypothetical protein
MRSLFLGVLLLFCAGCETPPPANLQSELSKHQVSDIAFTSMDPKWSGFGTYLTGMTTSLDTHWGETREAGKEDPTSGSVVSVTFVLASSGQVSRIVSCDDHGSGASAFTRKGCMEAITDASPFLQWTDEMVAALGREQKMTLTFWVP